MQMYSYDAMPMFSYDVMHSVKFTKNVYSCTYNRVFLYLKTCIPVVLGGADFEENYHFLCQQSLRILSNSTRRRASDDSSASRTNSYLMIIGNLWNLKIIRWQIRFEDV